MFTSQLSLHYTGSTNTTEMIKDEPHAVTHVKLVLDSLTPQIAKEIGTEFHDSLFTKDGQILDHVSLINVRLRRPQQALTFRTATNMPELVEMRNVRIPRITVAKRGEAKDEEPARKSRKVAPTNATLRVTLNCLMLPETTHAREFLCRQPGNTFLVDFSDEARQLDFGPDPEDGEADGGTERQPSLEDVDEAPGEPGRRAHAISDQAIAAALFEVGIELRPQEIAAMTGDQRQQTIDAVDAFQHARERNMAPLPTFPDFIMNPTLLVPRVPDPRAGDVLDEASADLPKKKRIVKGTFSNTVKDQLKAKKGKR